MTALHLADGPGVADLAGYLIRLLRYDKAAVVHLRADGAVLGTFGRLPFGGGTSGVIALRTTELREPARLDAAVSAGQLLDVLAAHDPEAVAHVHGHRHDAGEADRDEAVVDLPPEVTGPPWSAMLPPRTGWAQLAALPIAGLVREVAEAVGRFRAMTEALPAERRTRAELDRLAEEVWSKALPGVPGTQLPLRAAHAAASLGFLGSVDAGAEASVLSVGGWLRLDAPYGSVSVRRSGGPSLFVPRRHA
ncbi:hypothetical protein [Yinghuangia seranimata]|uniref:hypothetical protein n=1 Tax=Yinghuangia seranimata TaxID=408067 RepID=UPI00248CEE5D|nr:hypothetical protein [Yinghuangia seranimata]MDI2127338.1 hypothetical protein [Yinghuangia seranimata]